jgi:hypothetical protein
VAKLRTLLQLFDSACCLIRILATPDEWLFPLSKDIANPSPLLPVLFFFRQTCHCYRYPITATFFVIWQYPLTSLHVDWLPQKSLSTEKDQETQILSTIRIPATPDEWLFPLSKDIANPSPLSPVLFFYSLHCGHFNGGKTFVLERFFRKKRGATPRGFRHCTPK